MGYIENFEDIMAMEQGNAAVHIWTAAGDMRSGAFAFKKQRCR